MCLNFVDNYFTQQIATADAAITKLFSSTTPSSLFAQELKGIFYGALGGSAGYATGGSIGIAAVIVRFANPWSLYIPALAGNAAATTITGAAYGGFAAVFVASLYSLAQSQENHVISAVNALYGHLAEQGQQACQSSFGGH